MKRYLLYISIISLGSLLFTQPITPKVTAEPTTPVVKKSISRPSESPKPTPTVIPTPSPSVAPSPAPVAPKPVVQQAPVAPVSSSHLALAEAAGISAGDFQYVDYIVSHESGWNTFATNASSGAYGMCQSLPGSKMASAGADWQTNPVTQLSWCNSYAQSRYGGWYGAYIFWVNHHWW